jgi:hypothetical protein
MFEPSKASQSAFDILTPSSFPHVNGPKPSALEINGVPVDPILYSPKRHLMPNEIEELVGGYQAGSTAKELGGRWGVHRTTVAAILRSEVYGFAIGPWTNEKSWPQSGCINRSCRWPPSLNAWRGIRTA